MCEMARTLCTEAKRNMTYVDLLLTLRPILLGILSGIFNVDEFKLTVVTENGFLTAGNFTPKQKSSSSADDVRDEGTTTVNNIGTGSEDLFRHNPSKHTPNEDATPDDPSPDPFSKGKKEMIDRVDSSQIPVYIYVLSMICEVVLGILSFRLSYKIVEDETADVQVVRDLREITLGHTSTDKPSDGTIKQDLAIERTERLRDSTLIDATASRPWWDGQGIQRDAGASGSLQDTFYDHDDGVGIMGGERRRHVTTEKQLVRSGARLEGRSNLNNKHLANKSGSTLIDALPSIVRLPLLFAVLCVFGHGVEATSHQRLTLTAGQTGVIPFHHEWSTSLPSVPYHTIGYEDIERPFYRGGRMYPDDLKVNDQQDRLTMSSVYHAQSLSVNLTIDPVKVEDAGIFVSTVISSDTHSDHSAFYLKINVNVYTPPDPAVCYISPSPHSKQLFYAVCSTTVGSGDTSITCFQNGEKVPYDEPNVEYPGVLTRKSWVVMMFPISCCSYEEGSDVTEETCDDFKWPPPTLTVKPTTPLPSSPASCFIIPTSTVHLFQTICSTTVGSSNAGLACYQNGLKVPYEEVKGDISEVFTLRFWVTLTSPISCCSYDEENGVTMETCDDFRWPPVTSRQKSTAMSTPPGDDGMLPNNDDFSTVSPPKGSAWRTQGAFLPMLINFLVAFIALDI